MWTSTSTGVWATSTRENAHEIFAKSKADHDEVIAAIQKAIEALEGQYGLVQVKSKSTSRRVRLRSRKASQSGLASPFNGYESGSANAGSASEMLQDLLSRYSEARTLLMSDENKAVSGQKELVVSNKQFVLDSRNTKNAKMAERRGKIEELKNDKEQMKAAFTELQDLATYLQELRPKCDDIRSTFDERKRRRETEISALQEVLDVLADPAAMGSA